MLKIEYKSKIEYKNVRIKFKVIDIPVQSEKKTYNLYHLIQDNTFREKIVFKNSSNIAYKLQIYNHKETDDFIELNPNLGYVQPNSTFEIWVKLKITAEIEKLHHFFKHDDDYRFPLKVIINNIKVPSIIILKFFVTTDKIDISKKFLNFDGIYADEANLIDIELFNKSALPQKYGLIMLPQQISIKPSIGTILPNEKGSLTVKYESKDFLGHREGDIV